MKKIWKKMAGVVLTVIMLLSMSISVMAAPDVTNPATKGTLTVTKEGSKFSIYRVMSATKNGKVYEYEPTTNWKGFFGNATYGGYTVEKLAGMNGDGINTTAPSPSKVKPSAEMQTLTANLLKYANANKIQPEPVLLSSGQAQTLDLGWYLVTEASSTAGTKEDGGQGAAVASKPMLVSLPQLIDNKWVYDVKMYPKDSNASLEKKIVREDKKADTNIVAIGKKVPFEVTTTIPTYSVEYDVSTIKYQFKDTLSKGFSYNNDMVIKVENTTLTDGNEYTLTKTGGNGTDTIITVTFDYAKIKGYADAGKTLVYNYSATVNEHAVIGGTIGNPNDAILIYTNRDHTENTIADKTKTFVYDLGVHKVDAEDETADMSGAEFSLRDGADKTANVIGKYTYDDAGNVVKIEGDKLTIGADGKVWFTGLGEGTYYLHEDKEPEGYKVLAGPVAITITGTKDGAGEYTGAYTVTTTAAGDVAEITQETHDNVLSFVAKIKNHALDSFTLPATGGIGRTIFYGAGCALMVFAVIAAIVMRRHRA